MANHKTRWIVGPDQIDLILELISFQPKGGTGSKDKIMRELQVELQCAVRDCKRAHEEDEAEAEETREAARASQ